MAHYKVILAYDGSKFRGSQRQVDQIRTVQGVVEHTLRKLGWTESTTKFAGRTDAGVHASGQVFTFSLVWRHSLDDLRSALNALLPKDIAARQVSETPEDFHPRFHAVARSYRYCIFSDSVRNPLKEQYAWRVWPAPDLSILQAAANVFLGIHNFAGFGSPTSPNGSTFRELSLANWYNDADHLIFDVTANAFLYHMVRRLVHVQVAAGQEKMQLDILKKHLQFPGEPPLQGLAPSQGLSLVKVHYLENIGDR
ncbi:MAG: tRNA pseudouridine(38-40) synthase TruA [Anaerolineae bacterium]|nr:tRNA pseudouridine(38-40) synthase TruA [Anaerolineae bacterium]